MADAAAIIRDLGQQVAQLTVDKAILQSDLDEARARLAKLEVPAKEAE
jgi:phage shock protein A